LAMQDQQGINRLESQLDTVLVLLQGIQSAVNDLKRSSSSRPAPAGPPLEGESSV
jgi:hypothetical protein